MLWENNTYGGLEMSRHQIWKQGAAVTAALSLVLAPGLAGCGTKETDTDTIAEKTESKEQKDRVMGRYLEEDVILPEDCGEISDMILLDSGSLRVCYYKANESLCYVDSADGGKTWGEAVNLAEALQVDTESYSLAYPRLGAGGEIFLSAFPLQEETDYSEEPETVFYYLGADGKGKILDIGKELTSAYVTNAKFTDKGTLIVSNMGNGLLEIDPADGSVVGKYEEGTSVTCFSPVGNRLVVVTDSTLHYYDLETGEPLEDAGAMTEHIASDEMNLQMISTSSYPVVFSEGDEEDSLFYVEGGGLYHYSFSGSVVEQVIDGSLNRISSPDTALIALDRDSEGSFYLAVQDASAEMGHSGKILKYSYSPDTPATPDTELTVYSLTDNSFIRQTAALFQKKYPDIYLNLEVGLSGEDGMTSTDALKNLNTEIMAGNGPDVLIMDGIPEDTYVEKGMLADISGILDKIQEEDGILSNIRDAYQEEDGSQYLMPVKFNIPFIQGEKADVEKASDLASMADMLESHQEEYTEMVMPISLMYGGSEGFLRLFADVNAPAWLKEDGTLDEALVTEYLKQAGRIYQAGQKTMDYIEEMGVQVYSISELRQMSSMGSTGMLTLGGNIKLAAGRLDSPNSLAYLYSVEQEKEGLAHSLWNGQAENCFIPVQTVGISAKAEQKDAAEKLVEFLFGKEGQVIGQSEGFPVNEAVYNSADYWAAGDENGNLGTAGSGNADTGEYIELDIVRADEAVTEEVRELGKTLTVPSKGNEIILDAVAKNGSRYLEGEISLEEAAKAAIQQVNLYLAE